MCASLTHLFIFQDLHVFRPQINPLLLPKATGKEQGQGGWVGGGCVGRGANMGRGRQQGAGE